MSKGSAGFLQDFSYFSGDGSPQFQCLRTALLELISSYRESGSLFDLQRGCEALADGVGEGDPKKASFIWLATEAELVDCGLIEMSSAQAGIDHALQEIEKRLVT